MKKKVLILIIILSLVVLILLLFNKTTKEIILKTNGGVPYIWTYKIENKNIVKISNIESVPVDPELDGGVVYEHYKLKGLKKGNTKIVFKYKSITDSKVEKTKIYNIKVDSFLNIKVRLEND